ncbi:extracellular solute-binding protein [Plantactinospora soyae]|uniref:Aldouronate transport system substrate-binding protein n=1 Tax=Plantactinospora soyae TaxID=1544732 RepID=A0A927MF37_9ACTN|nr:extracellular solute-binding protein [Plantactinospora soyae]MBE1489970.1 putative aldouronate transport system substrate-binding protein [Plantactinospora soyae]
MTSSSSIGRRQFLTGALGTAAAVATPGLLAGCGGGGGPTGGGNNQASGSVRLPNYTPYTGVTPDLRGNPQGLLDAFLKYPEPAVRATNAAPGDGGPVSAFVLTNSPVPPALGQNPFWQELNKRLGADLRLTIVPSADMPTKFATLVAGDDLPDLIVPALFTPNGLPAGTANLPAWLAAKCQDLTPYLSGDAVNDYPFLANLPADAWRDCRYNGGIYGLPVPRGVGGTLMMRRDDVFKQLGVDPQPGSFAEFRELCRKVTDARANRWALASSPLDFIRQMLGNPWRWRLEGGQLVSAYEGEEYKQALADATQLVKDGVVHPDSFSNNAPLKKWFNSGSALLITDRYTAWPQFFAENVAGPTFEIGGMRPPVHGGGGFAATWQAQATNNFTAFKKADEGRIRALLKVCNWLAAPFGTEEWLLRRYGVAGKHYNMRGGGPTLTQAGVSQTVLGVRYIVDAPDVIFVPGEAEATRKSYEYQASIIPTAIKDPTLGVFSDTWSRKSGQLGTIVNDANHDILSGRKPVSAWDDIVKQWRNTGGDQCRTEFEDGIKNSGD